MDTTPEYVKMCEKAVEVQELWEPQAGDYVKSSLLCEDYKRFLLVTSYFYGVACGTPINNDISSISITIKDTWLPRQDQLQAMVVEKQSHWMISLGRLNRWLSEPSDKFKTPMSMEQLWLAFVMHKRFNKKWNGSDWEATCPTQ